MGNSSSADSVYESKLKQLNETGISDNDGDKLIITNWPCDVLAIILTYCHRAEQIQLINLTFPNKLNHHDKELQNVLDCLVTNPYTDSKVIDNFNAKYHQNVLENHNINGSENIFIYFKNIKLNGTVNNLNYLKSNKKSVIYAFLFYLTRKNIVFKRENTSQSVEIDKFIQGFKKNKSHKFEEHKAFQVNESKLDNIEYKNEYEFHQFERIIDHEMYNNLTWKQFNDIYMKNAINDMLNYCGDKMKRDNFDNINYGIDDIESLNILIAPTLLNELNGYCIASTISKYTSFVGSNNMSFGAWSNSYNSMKKQKKTMIKTSKYCHLCFFNWSTNNIAVISMMNKESSQHIKETNNFGKEIVELFVN